MLRVFMLILRLLRLQTNKIVFSSFEGTQYSAQPRMISEWLMNSELADHYDIVWICADRKRCPQKIRCVPPHGIRTVYELMTASVWVDNCRKRYWLKKKNGQLYIQTWHGPVCIKAVENDAVKNLNQDYIRSARQDSKNADYIVAEAEWRKKNIRKSFWYSGAIIEGRFIDKKLVDTLYISNHVKKSFGINIEEHVALYVPTFRKYGNTDHYIKNFKVIKKSLEIRYPGNWKIIVRLHPNVAENADYIEYNDYVLNGTEYPNAEDLICAADIVITDYSGCIFDAMERGKKVLLYAEDYDEYVSEDRGMYFDLRNLPSPFSENIEQLCEAIGSFEDNKYEQRRKKFIESLGYYESDATEICGKYIIEHIQKLEKNNDHRLHNRSI